MRSIALEGAAGRVYGPCERGGAERVYPFPAAKVRGRCFTFRERSLSGGNSGAVVMGVFAKP